MKSVGLINSKEENLRHLRNPRDLSSPSRASRKEDSERLSPVFKSPKEVPCPEDGLTQSLSRIIYHEVHISPYLQEVLLSHSLLCEMPILGEVLSEIAPIQYFC